MRAALISAAGRAPTLADCPVPTPSPGENLVRVTAAAVSHLVKACALGAHCIALLLGAGRIMATGRNARALEELQSLVADATIRLDDDMEALQHRFMEGCSRGVDIVLDYLWGPSAGNLLIAAARVGRDAVPMRFVQIGSISAPNITLPSDVLRVSAIELMGGGGGGGSIALPHLTAIVGEVLRAAALDGLKIAFKPVPISDFDAAWPRDDSACRTVSAMNTEGV